MVHDLSTIASISQTTITDSLRSLSTNTSISTAGESIPREQRPIWISPGLKTPTWGNATSGGDLSMVCSTSIHAPLALVVSLIIDVRTYPSWNSFAPTTTITHQPKSTAPLPHCLRGSDYTDGVANNTTTLRDGTNFILDVLMDSSPEAHRPRYASGGCSPVSGGSAHHHQPRTRTSPTLVVTCLDQFERDGRIGVRIAWRIKSRMAGLLYKTERVQELLPSEDDPEGTIEYRNWETHYGMFSGSIKSLMGKSIEVGYGGWMDGLKAFAEAKSERAREMKGH
ncbi:hypothetical protein N3K66_000621 [Trichothecium roseum]|uniref:Uncharacterized protein n=1 Tax=Trichothecium roseum TaxID=47278 RepID=A0ACC0VCB8_9HYPO|nr:hypothetical protein N3K66_000621 [Trichothecium roseum]